MKHLKARNEKAEIGDQRVCRDRRKFSYAAYVPERRSNMDRRDINATQSNSKVVYG